MAGKQNGKIRTYLFRAPGPPNTFLPPAYFSTQFRHTRITRNNQQKQATHHGPFDANDDPQRDPSSL
eukprot:scaffold32165_cov44-Attheya_sp.AAC.1